MVYFSIIIFWDIQIKVIKGFFFVLEIQYNFVIIDIIKYKIIIVKFYLLYSLIIFKIFVIKKIKKLIVIKFIILIIYRDLDMINLDKINFIFFYMKVL